jgi:hypothetical protein
MASGNGCHGGDTATLPFQHLVADPQLQRPARVSRFLYDPEALEQRRVPSQGLGQGTSTSKDASLPSTSPTASPRS